MYHQIIENTFNCLKGNKFTRLCLEDEPMWDAPIVGVSAGDDPYYEFLKEHIGRFHWTPAEAFARKYSDSASADKLCVISMIFPHTQATINMQKSARDFPSDRWLIAREEWEGLMDEFSPALEKAFEENGIRAASLDCVHGLQVHQSETLGYASNWSHRHSAYAAGLGTFGLSDGLITEKGIAIRISTIIVEADFEPTTIKDLGPYDWCTKCGACIRQCPCSAIDESGHNKNVCADYEDYCIDNLWPNYLPKTGKKFGCGLCQVKVPCSFRRPPVEGDK